MSAPTATDRDLEAFLDETAERRIESYKELLRIPSISGLSQHSGDVRRAAEWVANDLRTTGIEHVEVSETAGHPIVYGDWLHADDAPTLLMYGHYDVQPVDPLDLWKHPPFEPFVGDGRMYGRGAADDKGQVHAQLRAMEALLKVRKRIPVNVRFLFEGEEESGSPSLDAWLEANKQRLTADAVIITDTGFFQGNRPAITLSVRGNMYAQIDVSGPHVDLHSGGFGGAVENPANALAWIIAELKGRDGVVRVPGFYDDVVPLSDEIRAEFASLPFDPDGLVAETGVPELAGERGYTVSERRGGRPTLDIPGLWGGFQGERTKTIIPAHAHAKVSCRLVANQDPHVIFERLKAFVLDIAPKGVRVEVNLLDTSLPLTTDAAEPVVQAAARALEAAFGAAPLYIRSGGSIPLAALVHHALDVPVVLMGFANPDDASHAPNENMLLANYESGIRSIVRLLDEVASTKLS
jgi:acetylornithine deacetylase/succinyl-diaminopimelate desuccinylase-like protein